MPGREYGFQKWVRQQDLIFQNQIQVPLKIITPLINTILENTIQVGIMCISDSAWEIKNSSLQLSFVMKGIVEYSQSFHIIEA